MDYREVLKTNTVLDRKYRIDRVIGAGGFGITYQAFDIGLAAPVAIKEYYPAQFGVRDASLSVRARSDNDRPLFDRLRSSFLREARTLAQFDHTAIVRVLSVFEAHGTAYMVMRFESGPSLKAWLQGLGRVPHQAELDRLLWPLLDAIELMHKSDFLHRDIAPDNIIVRVDGTPVLLDFGASRRVLTDMSGTLTGVIKQGYSPQEQYASDVRSQGAWTDIYSLGATLYLCVTGKVPTEATARMLEDGLMPALECANGAFRPEFLASIDAAMQLHPRNRPQSVAEWREMLFHGAEPGWYPEGGDGFLDSSTGGGVAGGPISFPRSGPGPQSRSRPSTSPQSRGRSQPRSAPPLVSGPREGVASSQPVEVSSADNDEPRTAPRLEANAVSTSTAAASTGSFGSRIADFALSTQGAVALGIGAMLLGGSMLLAFEGGHRQGNFPLVGYSQSPVHPKPATQETVNQAGEAARREQERQAELARQQQIERERAEAARREQERQAELARQQQIERERAEAARREQERQTELARQQQIERERAEAARREQERQAEIARQQQVERERAEAARREQERQAALARQQQIERERAEAARREQERQAELARQQQVERERAEAARREQERQAAVARQQAERERAEAARRAQQQAPADPALTRRAVFADAVREPGQFAQSIDAAPNLFVAGGTGGQLRLWNLASGQVFDVSARHTAPISAVAASTDGGRVVSGSSDGEVRVWDARSGSLLHAVASGRGAVVALHYRTARRVLAVHASGTWAIIDPETGQSLMTGGRASAGSITAADISGDGRTIFAALADANGGHSVETWVPADGGETRQTGRTTVTGGQVIAVAASPDGRSLVSASADGGVRLQELGRASEIRVLTGTSGQTRALAFSPSGALIAGAGADGTVNVWQASDGARVASFGGAIPALATVTFSDDGASLAAAGEDGLLRQWSLPAALAALSPVQQRTPAVEPASVVVPKVSPPRQEETQRPVRVQRERRAPQVERRSPPPERRAPSSGGGGGGGGVRVPAF